MKPPAYYLGGKARIAASIVDVIEPRETFVDLCCGSGGVFLEVAQRGVVPVRSIVAIDAGPWGDVWAAVGGGTFPIDMLARYASDYRAETWQAALDDIAREPDLAAFVLTQAGSFGGLAVDWRGKSWGPRRARKHAGPGQLPSVPQPSVVVARLREICDRLVGMSGARLTLDAQIVEGAPRGWCVYMDPPYRNTAGYGRDLDYMSVARSVGGCWVSEAVRLSDRAVLLSSNKRALGGTTKKPREEWLSYVS